MDERREPDLKLCRATAVSIQPNLQKDQLVVLESTTYPGTTASLVLPILEKSGLRCPLGQGLEKRQIDGVRLLAGVFSEREDPATSSLVWRKSRRSWAA